MQSQSATTVCHAPAHGALAYARRQPESTLLYKTLREHWLGFLTEIETDGGELPAFVRDEFEAYFRCGILAHGFLRVRCKGCGHSRVVGFSCKRRGFCPSCLGRRMADTAAFCVDRLLPRVPVPTRSDASLLFHPLPAPTEEDVARVARAVSRKVTRVLARRRPGAEEQASLLDELANASMQGLVATGRRRGRHLLRLATGGDAAEAAIIRRRCADVAGFNVHASVRVRANDRDGLERLVKYLARPPIASDRLSELPDGRLALAFKHPWRNGTTHVVFTPHELIEKLIPLIPRPRAHLVRYHGILGPAAKDRAKVVPGTVGPRSRPSVAGGEPRELDASGMPRLGRLPWAVLLKRVFLVDVLECPRCKGRMKILAAVTVPASIRRVLDHLGLPSEAPRPRPARPPPQLELAEGRQPPDGFYPDPPSPEW